MRANAKSRTCLAINLHFTASEANLHENLKQSGSCELQEDTAHEAEEEIRILTRNYRIRRPEIAVYSVAQI